MSPYELTPLHFQSLHAVWKKRLSPSSIHHYNSTLKGIVRNIAAMCDRQDLVHQVPKVRPGQPRKTIAEPQEIEKLIAAAPKWMQAIILLASNAGLRRSDCLQAAPIHWNSETRILTLRMKKTGRTVSIPATERLAQFLDSAPTGNPTTPFYALYRDKPITDSGLDRAWQRLKKKAGVNPDLWLHDLRRTLAVALYEVSKDLRVVEQMLGHQSLQSTIGYLEHRDPAKLKPYLDAMFIPKGPVQ